jgi:ketosteroid isomerase-like protein
MTQVLGDLVRKGFEAWNAGDRSWVLEHMRPDAEWITPPDDPEPGRYQGQAEIIRFWNQWRSAGGHLRFEILDLVEVPPHVLVLARRSGTGLHSGLSVSDEVSQVFTFEDDVCVRVEEFYDRAAAARSAGLESFVAEADRRTR